MSDPYEIDYAEEAVSDIGAMRAFDRTKVLDVVEEHLTYQPTTVSKSRIKAMLQPFWSQYRLRADEYRIYYDVDEESRAVHILRVLMKGTEPTPEEPT